MDTLERKEKRLEFLRELYNIGIESVYKQMIEPVMKLP